MKFIFLIAGMIAGLVIGILVTLPRERPTAEGLVIPPHKFISVVGQAPFRYVSATGSWRIEGPEKSGFPKQVVKYECYEPFGTCQYAEATVFDDALDLSQTVYEQVEWGANQVVIRNPGVGDACRSETISIDLLAEQLTSITQDRTPRPDDCDGRVEKLAEPRRSTLIDGFDRTFQMRNVDGDDGGQL